MSQRNRNKVVLVVAITLFSQCRSLAGLPAVVALLCASQPALANSSNAADIAAPLRAAQEARQTALGSGDAEFRKLFTSWRSLDRLPTNNLAAASSLPQAQVGITGGTSVSIPSRMPVEGITMTSGFGMRFHPVLGGYRAHKGVDLAASIGTPVHATADGIVSQAEWFSSYGLYVSIEHGGELQTRYGHMSRLNVAAGQQVHKGDVVGFVGSTGRSTGPHLHYEVRVAGQAVNPVPYMQANSTVQSSEASGASIAAR